METNVLRRILEIKRQAIWQTNDKQATNEQQATSIGANAISSNKEMSKWH
jgi:hypothetical protein